jgi:hypothetical protein
MKKIIKKTVAISKNKGFIQIIVVIVIALIVLRLLGFSIATILSKPWAHEFAVTVKSMLVAVWADIKAIFFFFRAA